MVSIHKKAEQNQHSRLRAVHSQYDVRRAIRDDSKKLGVSYGEFVVLAIRQKHGYQFEQMIEEDMIN